MKSFGDRRIAEGEKILVADLGGCTGMDSTFMGTLAGLAQRLMLQEGSLQIADPGEKNRRSLEDLGLDHLMEIDPPNALWRGNLEQIRNDLVGTPALGSQSMDERARHVLDAHVTLSGTSEKNAEVFANVVETLGKKLARPGEPRKTDL